MASSWRGCIATAGSHAGLDGVRCQKNAGTVNCGSGDPGVFFSREVLEMTTETKISSGSRLAAGDIDLLSRQLAERGFYIIGRMPPPSSQPAPSPQDDRSQPSRPGRL